MNRTMSREWYKYADKLYEKVKIQIKREFARSRALLPFDELNITGAVKESKRLYEKLDKLNRTQFLMLAKKVYEDSCKECLKIPNPDRNLDKWLLWLLLSYDPITKYVYTHEVDRKRARFQEAIMTDAQRNSRRGLDSDYKIARDLWTRQAHQYFIDIEDAAALQAFMDCGVKSVMWMTNQDERRCKVCKNRHGRIYPINNVPDKPHYNCRCWLAPIL